jgi:hypothetical protein
MQWHVSSNILVWYTVLLMHNHGYLSEKEQDGVQARYDCAIVLYRCG